MKVKNARGTGIRKECKCGSWLRHWSSFSGRSANQCSVKGCTRTDVVGGHVEKRVGGLEYIVPLCAAHNHVTNTAWMELNAGVDLVRANKQATCD